jgi:hypothetical protein
MSIHEMDRGFKLQFAVAKTVVTEESPVNVEGRAFYQSGNNYSNACARQAVIKFTASVDPCSISYEREQIHRRTPP